MLDFIGTIITAALMMLVVSALITFMDMPRSAKLTLAALIGLWIGLAAAVAAAGMLAISKPFPVVGIFVAAPLIAAGIATAWPAARAAMLSVPMPVMIGLNVVRVFAVLFLLLAVAGRLSGPFPYSAGWGDIITGAFGCLCCGLRKPEAPGTPRRLQPGTCSVQSISCWRSRSVSHRRTARRCSYSRLRARLRCRTCRGRSFQQYWSRSG